MILKAKRSFVTHKIHFNESQSNSGSFTDDFDDLHDLDHLFDDM